MKQDEKKKVGRKNEIVLVCVWCITVAWCLFCNITPIVAATPNVADMSMFSGVTVSPNRMAWTTDYLDKTNERLGLGHTIHTGIESALRKLEKGEHYYSVTAKGSIRIGKWVVAWPNAQCIHENSYYDSFCGFPIQSNTVCFSRYNNGWYAYCADCGELVDDVLFYGKSSTIGGITSMPADGIYLYVCPYCQGLEQGRAYPHVCKAISNNYYEIVYDANPPAGAGGSGNGGNSDCSNVEILVEGFMAPTKHMYNNASTYNGVSAKKLGYGDLSLRRNVYNCKGYKFVGWNTKPDGSGTYLEDCAKVFNLTDEDGGTVRLYAQWKKSQSTLILDANGGQYEGKALYEKIQDYGTIYQVDNKRITPAAGYEVTFVTNGGSALEKIRTTKSFSHWELQSGFQGKFQDNVYTFLGDDGSRNSLKARYMNNGFVLPDSVKEDKSLEGWYSDPGLSEDDFVGKPGDKVVVEKDTVLYAKWAVLTLWAYDDYDSNQGHGAVDLKWEQKDGQSKYYKLFQSIDKTNWKEILSADTIVSDITVSEAFDTAKQGEKHVIQRTGYYALIANGAKGADYNAELKGGAGGSVRAEYWLQKGDVVSFYAGTTGNGTSGGSNQSISVGGSSSSDLGRGGGAATEIYVNRNGAKTLLLIAGGGGGANERYSGGAGGISLTSVGETEGKISDYGGGGGGAQGGNAGGTTWITNATDSPDFVFKSNITKNLPAGTVQVYGMREELETPPLKKVSGNGQDTWKWITKMGTISSEFHSSYSLWYDNDDCLFVGSSTGEAAVGTVPHIQAQVRDGITMHLSCTHETGGNTKLLVGGGLFRQDCGASGNIQLRLIVTNAETGAVLYNERIYKGYTNNDKAGIAAVVDIDISTAQKINITLVSDTEGTFEDSQGHIAQLYFSDIILYGKTASEARATTGGSSYINTGFGCKNQQKVTGANAGEGYAQIKGTDIGYKEETSLDDVCANDKKAPDVIKEYSVSISDVNKVKVTLGSPQDHGTTYYHIAKSYRLEADKVKELAVSNITESILTTGVTGYYYYLDGQENGTVDIQDSWISTGSGQDILNVTLTEPVMYLHVAAADGAGNIGPTKNIPLKMDLTLPTDPSYAEKRTMFTRQLALEDNEFVYQESADKYYVKADGRTEHKMMAEAYLDGVATQDYQIDSIYLRVGENSQIYPEWMQVVVPRADIAESHIKYSNDSLSMGLSDNYHNYMKIESVCAERSGHGVTISLEKRFSVRANGDAFVIYPQAYTELNGQAFYSKEEYDMENRIFIMPDSVAPTIQGLEELEAIDVLDMTEQAKYFELKAEDIGSGLGEFVICVSNRDNLMKEEFVCDDQGSILLKIDKDNALFVGEIVVSAIAVDRVGNANIIGEEGLTFTLETALYKERNPEESIFKTGDGAVLDIATAGYVEKMEIIFPEELVKQNPNLPLVYEYEYPSLRNTETIKFNIPLGIPEQEYEITVKAYKNGEMLVSKQTLVVVKGNVLDELRTRIRNNG